MSISKENLIEEQALIKELEKHTRSIAHLGHVEIGRH